MSAVNKHTDPGETGRVPFWRSLQTKFSLTYIAVIAAMALLLNTYPVLASQNLVFQSKQTAMWNQASTLVGPLAGLGTETLTEPGIQRVVEQMGGVGATRLMVTDPAGRILYDNSETANDVGRYALLGEVVSALGGNRYFRSEYRDGAFRSRAAVPVTYRNMTIGAVYLYEYDKEQGELLIGIQKNLRNISLVISAVALLLSLVFTHALTRRIAAFLEAVRIVRRGEYSHRVALSGSDELSRLADEFDQLTSRLQTTEEVRRRFVADASHELKTPLASIRLLTDSILQSENMDRSTAKEFVSDIGDEAERLTRITEHLLALTRLDNAANVETEPVDMKDVVERVCHMLEPLAAANGVALERALAGECTVRAAADDLYQVAFNLVENAVKYNVRGGKVFITLEREGEPPFVAFRVEDTGVGIPEEDLPKIFDRFYRVDKARSRAAGGTGLGLSIVKDTVHRHGGTVTARRREPEGSCFDVRFPLCREEVAGP